MRGCPLCTACTVKESHRSKKARRCINTGWGKWPMSTVPAGGGGGDEDEKNKKEEKEEVMLRS